MTDSPSRKKERAVAIAELQALIDDGLASGISTRTLDEIFEVARAEADARDKAWLIESKAAIAAYNKRIDESGTLITPIWLRAE